jgi:Flp pilus assembly protein TadG
MRTARRLSWRELFRSFRRDESGNYVIIGALVMPILVGMAAFGTEQGMLLHKKQVMQHAADSAAVTAALSVAAGANDNGAAQAKSVAATYGFSTTLLTSTNTNTVVINSPPTSGPNTANRAAIEVIISQPQPRLFSTIWGSAAYPVAARAVATPQGKACILTLDPTASGAYSEQGTPDVNLIKCAVVDDSSNASALNVGGSATLKTTFVGVVGGISGTSGITATYGTTTGYHYVADPYAGVSYPAYHGCDQTNYSTHANPTISPGVYCGGMNLGSHASVTLNPGIYYLDGGSLSMTGQTSLSGTGVTLVFTSSSGSNYATASLTGGATLNLTAPTTGPLAGIAIFGDRNMPVGTTFKFAGGDTQTVSGVVYLPKAALQWAGNSSAQQKCTQIVTDTISMVGTSGLQVDCSGMTVKQIGSPGLLVE